MKHFHNTGCALQCDAAKKRHLFTYGSLKPGGRFYPRIEPYVLNAREATVFGELYDTGNGWPAAKLSEHGDAFSDAAIKGILYDVRYIDWDVLVSHMDYIEGYPSLFERTYTQAWPIGESFYVPDALVYFGNQESLFKTRIESGEWVI